MASPSERLASALKKIKVLHGKSMVIAASELAETDRARLLKAGYLQPVIRGWYLTTRPDEAAGDTTAWQANWRPFLARYCKKRFASGWHLSPEQSLAEQTATPLVSRQISVYAKSAHNNVTTLLHGWSILEIKTPKLASRNDVEDHQGLRVLSIPYALTEVSEHFFRTNQQTAQLALQLLPDTSDLARILIAAGKPVVGGRLVAALRAIGRDRDAGELRKTLESVGYRAMETSPFDLAPTIIGGNILRSPYVLRIHQMWAAMRDDVVAQFVNPPRLPKLKRDIDTYLADVDARYLNDAYHSLSIEGYNVSEELIERVRSGKWDAGAADDKCSRDTLAAKGYNLAHDGVKKMIRNLLTGDGKGANTNAKINSRPNPGSLLRSSLSDWNRALWTPSVQAGILRGEDLAGYRNSPVFIRNADHVPPPREAVRDAMPALFDLIEQEPDAAARAVLGHFMFVFIHPYMDGNGRLGRFVMNAMLASGGYPWTVIKVDDRAKYFDVLNAASGHGDIKPFAKFISGLVRAQSKRLPVNKK